MIPNKSGKLEEATTQLVAANRKSLKLLGEVQLTLEVQEEVFLGRAIVGKEVVHPMVVGVEFIITNGGVINFKDQQLAYDGPGEQIDEKNTSKFKDLDSAIDIPYVQ